MGATNDNLEELKRVSKQDVGPLGIYGFFNRQYACGPTKTLEEIFQLDHQLITHCEDKQTIRNNLEKPRHNMERIYLCPCIL